METNNFFGGALKKYHSDIGEVISFVPRYHVGGALGVRNSFFPRQRIGYGWGQSILSFFRPFLKKGLKEVANFASNVASDALEGQNVKESLKKHGMTGISNILQDPASSEKIEQSVIPKKRVSAAVVARRKPKIVKKSKSEVSGSGKKKKEKSNISNKLTKKFPILEYM
jgi:hypothetical protein